MTQSTPISKDYTIEQITLERWDNDLELRKWFVFSSAIISKRHGDDYNWGNFNIRHYIQHYRLVICFRNGIPVGMTLSRIVGSIFDPTFRQLVQDLLYAEPGTRAVKFLLDEFIDFGRQYADHVFTVTGESFNISERSILKRGFKKFETTYCLEV